MADEAFRPIAVRMDQARDMLEATIKRTSGETDAARIRVTAQALIDTKLVKLDVAHGRYDFKHGALLDADTMRQIVSNANTK